jgi:hypothetical protein
MAWCSVKKAQGQLYFYLYPSIMPLSLEEVQKVHHTRVYEKKFPDWLPGARSANGTALCH